MKQESTLASQPTVISASRVYVRSGRLSIDLRANRRRYRLATGLTDCAEHRRDCQRLIERAVRDARLGRFDIDTLRSTESRTKIPTLTEFASLWLEQMGPAWRHSYRDTVLSVLRTHLLPECGDRPIDRIDRRDVMALRSRLLQEGRAPATVNRILHLLTSIVREGCRQHRRQVPDIQVARLRVARTATRPFSVDEIHRILSAAPGHYRPYLALRFSSGLRAGEIDGLCWKNVDLDRGRLHVSETWSNRRRGGVKTTQSMRDVQLNALALAALEMQHRRTGNADGPVFVDEQGRLIESSRFSAAIWYPLLRKLGFDPRSPRHTRHTFASLSLAAGESPSWIAAQLGHAGTAQFHSTYSRYLPNPCRPDGASLAQIFRGSAYTLRELSNAAVGEST